MIIGESERLCIRHFLLSDTDYILTQLNDAAFIQNIADKNVKTKAEAELYLQNSPLESYKLNGFGLNMVQLKETLEPIGMCGLVKRPELDTPDLGYAFLPNYWRKGYAEEACNIVLSHAKHNLKINEVLAITLPDNTASNYLLRKLGFKRDGVAQLYGFENNQYRYFL
ncbi:GNAT family N-acetyltransferase [Sessilibacter sp. MAH4]